MTITWEEIIAAIRARVRADLDVRDEDLKALSDLSIDVRARDLIHVKIINTENRCLKALKWSEKLSVLIKN